jgi:hypothetical protein
MTRRRAARLAGVTLITALAVAAPAIAGLRVRGNRLVDGPGRAIARTGISTA